MNNLIIKSNKETPYKPEVIFDYNKGVCKIEGDSYMEDAFLFYKPLFKWISEYDKNKLELILKFNYFNTTSSKCIIYLFDSLKDLKNVDFAVKWYYDGDDDDMLKDIEDMERESKISIIKIKV